MILKVCLLTCTLLIRMSYSDSVPEYVKVSDLKNLIAEATAPLLGRIEKLEAKVAELDIQDAQQKTNIRNQEELLKQYETKLSSMAKSATTNNGRCMSLAKRVRFLEAVVKSTRPTKNARKGNPMAIKHTEQDVATGHFGPVVPDEDKPRPERKRDNTSGNGPAGSTIQRRAIEFPVAFEAKMVTTLRGLTLNSDIVFDTVITNIGSAYHASHGVFIAPVTGIYVFGLTIMSEPGHGGHYGIAVDGVSKTKVYSDATTHPGHDHASISLVVRLDKGQDVSARNIDYSGRSVYGDSYSEFHGFLLTEDVTSVAPVG